MIFYSISILPFSAMWHKNMTWEYGNIMCRTQAHLRSGSILTKGPLGIMVKHNICEIFFIFALKIIWAVRTKIKDGGCPL